MRPWIVLLAALMVVPTVDAQSASSQSCVLSTRWSHQPPYWIAVPGQPPTGYLVEVIREAAGRIGCDVRFKEMNWARGVSELKAGRLDLMAGSVRNAERERYARFTRPINTARNVLLLRAEVASTTPLRTLADLADTELTIGIQAGGVYGEEYGRLIDQPRFARRLNPVSTPRASWRMLAEGRLDGIITDEVNALVQRADGYGHVSLEPVLVLSNEPSRIMVGRHVGAEKTAALDDALAAMVSDGWLPRRREAWVPCATDPETMGCRIDPSADDARAPSAPDIVDF